MKRFLMLVGVAVVAAAMYVAASPAIQQSKGPTAKQFKALKAQVASLSKTVKAVKTLVLDSELRRRVIQGGYAMARAHTLEQQAADMMQVVTQEIRA